MPNSRRKVLVCGATGFIGRNIADFLSKHDDLEIFGTYFQSKPYPNPRITWLRSDLTKKKDVLRAIAKKDVVIQAAAVTSGSKEIVTKPYIHTTDNAIMNSLIFRAAHEQSLPHLIFFSCTVMYSSSDIPLRETDFDPNGKIHPKYFGGAWTKVYAEKMCEFYASLGRTRYTVIRHSNIYGPHDKFDSERSHVVGATIAKVIEAADSKIMVWGEGKEERDLLYIDDLVQFVELSLDKQTTPFELCNVGYGKSISVKNLVYDIVRISGKKLDLQYDPSKPNINTRLCLNIDRAREIFSWMPTTSLERGLEKTIQWYADHG